MNSRTGPTPVTASRRSILDRIESWSRPSTPHPEVDAERLSKFEDPLARFLEMLAFVGGDAHQVDRLDSIREILMGIPAFADADRIASLVPEAVEGNVDVHSESDPFAFEALDWMVVRGEFLVAENGAIWIEGAGLPHRVLLFIAQYQAVVVSRSQIVQQMHDAYQRIGKPTSPFGVFVSGPSKTADIEQSLVLGAHGCRKLQVFLTP